MGKFDSIESTPDFWTSALSSFGENYDRLVQAKEINKQDERYNQQQSVASDERIKEEQRYNEQTFTERERYSEQQKLAKQEKDREEWQYMFEQVLPTQKSLMYKNGLFNNISGLTGTGLEALQNSEAVNATLNTRVQDFFTGDAEYKHRVGAALASNLIANNQNDQAARITSELKETRSQIENKKVFDILSGQFPNLIAPGVKGMLSNMGDLSDSQLEAVMTTITQKSDDIDSQRKLAQELIKIGSAELQTPATNSAFTMGTLLLEKINTTSQGEEETKEDDSLELSNFDERITGKDDSFDRRTEKDKQKIFNAVALKYKDEYESNPKKFGKKIIDEINKTKYRTPAVASGFAGIEYEDPEEVVEVTQSMIDEEVESLKKSKKYKIPKGQQDNPKIIEQLQLEAQKNVEDKLEKESRKRAQSIAQSTQRQESIMGK
jgi:hypothetical protein